MSNEKIIDLNSVAESLKSFMLRLEATGVKTTGLTWRDNHKITKSPIDPDSVGFGLCVDEMEFAVHVYDIGAVDVIWYDASGSKDKYQDVENNKDVEELLIKLEKEIIQDLSL